MVWYAKYMAPHMRKPSKGLWGYCGWRFLIRMNTQLEQATFEKLQAKDSDDVLELGFGPGRSIGSGAGRISLLVHSHIDNRAE